MPKDCRVSFCPEIIMPETYWQAIGYLCLNNFAVRVDVFERIFFIARKKIKIGPFLDKQGAKWSIIIAGIVVVLSAGFYFLFMK